VALVASFDHVDTPALWGAATAARFNWRLHDATTYGGQFQDLARAGIAAALAGGKCASCHRLWPARRCAQALQLHCCVLQFGLLAAGTHGPPVRNIVDIELTSSGHHKRSRVCSCSGVYD